jgi:hypothetical protein
MPLLNWSLVTAAIASKDQRAQMTRLFDAYFHVSGEEDKAALQGKVLHLDLPAESASRYHFHAPFTKDWGWFVNATLKSKYIRFEAPAPRI